MTNLKSYRFQMFTLRNGWGAVSPPGSMAPEGGGRMAAEMWSLSHEPRENPGIVETGDYRSGSGGTILIERAEMVSLSGNGITR